MCLKQPRKCKILFCSKHQEPVCCRYCEDGSECSEICLSAYGGDKCPYIIEENGGDEYGFGLPN